MKLFSRQKGEALAEIKSHLMTEDANGTCTGTVALLNTLIEDSTEEIKICLQNRVILAG